MQIEPYREMMTFYQQKQKGDVQYLLLLFLII